jgi:hypothetical protein
MPPIIHQLLRYAGRANFLWIWLIVLAMAVIYGLMIAKEEKKCFAPIGARHPLRRSSPIDIISMVCLFGILALYAAVLIYHEEFVYYDNNVLTDFSLRGINMPLSIWPADGRFMPLYLQEFNLLRYLTTSPVGYHSFAIIQFLILIVSSFFLLSKLPIRYRVLALIAVMFSPSCVISFSELVLGSERMVLFWLAILLLCLRGYENSKSRTCFIGALIATQFALYYKETAVLFIVFYALTRILLYARAKLSSRTLRWRDLIKENSLSLGMLALSTAFVIFFLLLAPPMGKASYVARYHMPVVTAILAYMHIDLIPFLLFTTVVVRFGRSLLNKNILDPLWDSVAVGACAVGAGTMAAGLFSGYYMAPVDFVALLYLTHLSAQWLMLPGTYRKVAMAIAYSCIVVQGFAYSSFSIFERKNLIMLNSHFAEYLQGYLQTTNERTIELYFPYTDGYRIMELSAFLRHKGFHVARLNDTVAASGPLLIAKGPQPFEGNRCIGYKDYICIHSQKAGSGALILVLPDDDVSGGQVRELAGNSQLLFHESGLPRLVGPGSRLRAMHCISPWFRESRLPDHWLQIHVFKM